MSNESAEEALARARYTACKSAPWFRGTLLSLIPIPMTEEEVIVFESIGGATLAVNANCVMLYNEQWVKAQTIDVLAGTLVHEALHIIFNSSERRGSRDKILWNCATDFAINQVVKEMGLNLPQGALFPQEHNLKPNLSSEDYYDILYKKIKKDQQGPGQGSDDKKGPCKGQCGTCATGDSDGQKDAHKADGRTPAGVNRVREAQAEAIQQAKQERNQGNIPAQLDRWAGEILTPPKIPWQQKLARWARQQITAKRGLRDFTYTKISRRQWGLPKDFPRLPSMVDHEVKVAIAVDTSGSMGDAELSAGLSEAKAILEQAGLKCRVVVCDAEVHVDCEVKSVIELRKKLKGGGGTDFRPVFDALSKGKKPDVLVFFTDGYGPAPEKTPPFGVIWLIIGGGKAPASWGETVHIE